MKIILLLGLMLQIFFNSMLLAIEVEGVLVSDQEMAGTIKLPLNGTGIRKATIFNIKVYLAEFYYPTKLTSEDELLSKPQPFVLKLHFFRDVSKEKIIDSFTGGFEKNKVALKDFDVAWRQLQSGIDNLNKGEELVFIYDGLKLLIKCKKLEASITQIEFIPQLLKLWFGTPPNEDLKKGLLNR